MKVYLAANYSRRLELLRYKEDLENIGIKVIARWLDGSHQIGLDGRPIGEHGEKLVEDGTSEVLLRQKFLNGDIQDCSGADLIISFTNSSNIYSHGGRHVEFGIGLALGKRLIIVGRRENLFHYHPHVLIFNNWNLCLQHLMQKF